MEWHMGLSSWFKERRLERTHAKLKHLRAIQSSLRDQENEIHAQRTRGADSPALESREKKLHDERDKITRQIRDLEAEEKQLKVELKA